MSLYNHRFGYYHFIQSYITFYIYYIIQMVGECGHRAQTCCFNTLSCLRYPQWKFKGQFQIFNDVSHDPVANATPSSVTPKHAIRLSCPLSTVTRSSRRTSQT